MKVIQLLVITIILCFQSTLGTAQIIEDELVVIGGEKFIIHQVKMGETIFSLSQKYKVERKEIVEKNPDVENGLNVDQRIKIPYKNNLIPEETTKQKDPSHFISHRIQRRETPYFIAKKYEISIDDIYKYNPGLKKLKKGQTIRIPQWREEKNVEEGQETKKPEQAPSKPEYQTKPEYQNDDIISHRVKPGETLYSISKLYNYTISEILFYNPDAKNPRIGMEIKLPKSRVRIDQKKERIVDETGSFFMHILETGETMYGIQKKYNVSREELIELNPVLEEHFPAGITIKVPIKNLPKSLVKPINEDAFTKHFVKKGETLYGLSNAYEIKIPEIKKFNPILQTRDGLIEGETILIPIKPDNSIVKFIGAQKEDSARLAEEYYQVETMVEIPEGCKTAKSPFFFEQYHIGLLLPLFLEANDTLNYSPFEEEVDDEEIVRFEEETADTIIEENLQENLIKKFYANSENFLHFYEGVAVAIDSMKKKGMNVTLHVFDTKREINEIYKIIHTDIFKEMDLIIGPVYPNTQKVVADYSAKNRIPMISPLSSKSEVVNYNPWFFQVNPSFDFLLDETAQLIADEYFDSNFVVLQMNNTENSPEARLVQLCHEKLFNTGYYNNTNDVSFRIYDFKNQGSFGIPRILSKDKENVFIIPSSHEGDISVAVSNINNHASKYNITVVGTNKYQTYESISQEHFHNVKLKYISPYWIDFQSETTNRFYSKFRESFKTEPNQYSVQGYDVSFYFLNALWNYGEDFRDCLPYLSVGLVQGNYNFEKVSQLGGYMNHGTSVISYSKDYEVSQQRKLRQLNYGINITSKVE